jgi:hypothetical protein
MAVTSIARIQHRRGVLVDLPSALNEGELGFTLDTRQLFVGNGPTFDGNTEILTQHSVLDHVIQTRWQSNLAPVQAQPLGVSRSIGSKFSDRASVRDFGAVGDGVTDDGVAINGMIEKLLKKSIVIGGTVDHSLRVTVHIPAGRYLLLSPLILYPGVVLEGEGKGNSVLLAGAGLSHVMSLGDSLGQTFNDIGGTGGSPPDQIQVKNLTIDTSGQNINAVLLWCYRGVMFENVSLKGGWTGSGPISAAFSLNSGSPSQQSQGAIIAHCDIDGFHYGAKVGYSDSTATAVTLTTFLANRFSNCEVGVVLGYDDSGIQGSMGRSGPANVKLLANSFSVMNSYGLSVLASATNVTSMGNSFQGCRVFPVDLDTGSSGVTSIGDVFDVSPGVKNQGSGNLIMSAPVSDFASDTAAATGGVPVNGVYRSGNTLKIRIS